MKGIFTNNDTNHLNWIRIFDCMGINTIFIKDRYEIKFVTYHITQIFDSGFVIMKILMLRNTGDECITRKDNILKWILRKI